MNGAMVTRVVVNDVDISPQQLCWVRRTGSGWIGMGWRSGGGGHCDLHVYVCICGSAIL